LCSSIKGKLKAKTLFFPHRFQRSILEQDECGSAIAILSFLMVPFWNSVVVGNALWIGGGGSDTESILPATSFQHLRLSYSYARNLWRTTLAHFSKLAPLCLRGPAAVVCIALLLLTRDELRSNVIDASFRSVEGAFRDGILASSCDRQLESEMYN
jgi:hypothetical protein